VGKPNEPDDGVEDGAGAEFLAVPLDEARAIYERMDAWRKSLLLKRGRSNGRKISQ
jgi:hypothetical protein